MERTFVMLKPDCVSRRLVGEVISRFEKKGLILIGLKLITIKKEQAEKLYEVHKGKSFYDDLINYATSGPVVIMVLSGMNAVAVARKLLGATFGFEAEPGTIRGDFSLSRGRNIVHGSDSPERAKFEIGIFFEDGELVNTAYKDLDIIYEKDELG